MESIWESMGKWGLEPRDFEAIGASCFQTDSCGYGSDRQKRRWINLKKPDSPKKAGMDWIVIWQLNWGTEKSRVPLGLNFWPTARLWKVKGGVPCRASKEAMSMFKPCRLQRMPEQLRGAHDSSLMSSLMSLWCALLHLAPNKIGVKLPKCIPKFGWWYKIYQKKTPVS
jgi:hypothetical protein